MWYMPTIAFPCAFVIDKWLNMNFRNNLCLMNVYKIYLFDICWMWCMLNGIFVTIKFIDISLWWKIYPQCYEGHGGGKGYAKFVSVASTWWVNIFQTLCTICFYTWWKKSFLELLTPTWYAYTLKKTCEKWKTNWIKKP